MTHGPQNVKKSFSCSKFPQWFRGPPSSLFKRWRSSLQVVERPELYVDPHLHLVPKLGMNGVTPLLPLYASMAWAGTPLLLPLTLNKMTVMIRRCPVSCKVLLWAVNLEYEFRWFQDRTRRFHGCSCTQMFRGLRFLLCYFIFPKPVSIKKNRQTHPPPPPLVTLVPSVIELNLTQQY
jgi:hypothetical protein